VLLDRSSTMLRASCSSIAQAMPYVRNARNALTKEPLTFILNPTLVIAREWSEILGSTGMESAAMAGGSRHA